MNIQATLEKRYEDVLDAMERGALGVTRRVSNETEFGPSLAIAVDGVEMWSATPRRVAPSSPLIADEIEWTEKWHDSVPDFVRADADRRTDAWHPRPKK